MLNVSLGIDTSNYKTSVAMIDQNYRIICDFQKLLEVKKGERGLRQSDALFQHIKNLPDLCREAFHLSRNQHSQIQVAAVSVSDRPRPIEGSYMPVFLAGINSAESIASALDVPLYRFSHQEGHIEAVCFTSPLKEAERFLSFHFSGGTTEGLLVEKRKEDQKITLIGGSRDLAFGQVLDRVGVAMGMAFPCGQEMDQLAAKIGIIEGRENLLPKIKCNEGFLNLSGIETKCQRLLGEIDENLLPAMLFTRLGQAMTDMTLQLSEAYGIKHILFAGGVSASAFLRCYLKETLSELEVYFGDPGLSTDNAVGIAVLGGKKVWR